MEIASILFFKNVIVSLFSHWRCGKRHESFERSVKKDFNSASNIIVSLSIATCHHFLSSPSHVLRIDVIAYTEFIRLSVRDYRSAYAINLGNLKSTEMPMSNENELVTYKWN